MSSEQITQETVPVETTTTETVQPTACLLYTSDAADE